MNENKCFTFTWKLENFSYSWQKNSECVWSPVFIVDAMGKTKWKLKLYPKGDTKEKKDFISFYLVRDDSTGPELDIYYDLSFLAADGSVLVSADIIKKSFAKNVGWGRHEFVKHDEVLKIRRMDYLPGNVLTVRCRMWNNIQEETEYGHCFARTRIVVERMSFLWNIEQFSSFQECQREIASASAEQSMITLKLFPSSGQKSKTFIRVEVHCSRSIVKNFNFSPISYGHFR
ncbi:hypothetical protein TNCV_4599591 [Trichonephila clavipes]|nr:hypothetical protein TNCV_4599591 [Trichonephila clavipes]